MRRSLLLAALAAALAVACLPFEAAGQESLPTITNEEHDHTSKGRKSLVVTAAGVALDPRHAAPLELIEQGTHTNTATSFLTAANVDLSAYSQVILIAQVTTVTGSSPTGVINIPFHDPDGTVIGSTAQYLVSGSINLSSGASGWVMALGQGVAEVNTTTANIAVRTSPVPVPPASRIRFTPGGTVSTLSMKWWLYGRK